LKMAVNMLSFFIAVAATGLNAVPVHHNLEHNQELELLKLEKDIEHLTFSQEKRNRRMRINQRHQRPKDGEYATKSGATMERKKFGNLLRLPIHVYHAVRSVFGSDQQEHEAEESDNETEIEGQRRIASMLAKQAEEDCIDAALAVHEAAIDACYELQQQYYEQHHYYDYEQQQQADPSTSPQPTSSATAAVDAAIAAFDAAIAGVDATAVDATAVDATAAGAPRPTTSGAPRLAPQQQPPVEAAPQQQLAATCGDCEIDQCLLDGQCKTIKAGNQALAKAGCKANGGVWCGSPRPTTSPGDEGMEMEKASLIEGLQVAKDAMKAAVAEAAAWQAESVAQEACFVAADEAYVIEECSVCIAEEESEECYIDASNNW